MLEDIVRHSDPAISVNTLADKETLRIGIDRMQFRVRSSDPGYLYVFFVGTKSTDLSLLFPNRLDADNRIGADAEVVLPRKGWNITAGGPPGTNQIVTMVSRVPRDFATIAPKDGEFDIAAAQQLWATASAADSPFAGTPRCDAGQPCDAAYGATLIRIHEAAAK